MDGWHYAIIAYVSIALLTALPTLKALWRGVDLFPGGPGFESSDHFTLEQKERLKRHFDRLSGTLRFWKSKAALFGAFHYYCISWTIISSWAVPLLCAVTPADSNSKWLITTVSAHVALALSFHKAFNIAENLKAFRLGESDFYDLRRRMLDRPQTFGKTAEEQIENYFEQVETIRKLIRFAEAGNIPTLQDVQGKLSADRRH